MSDVNHILFSCAFVDQMRTEIRNLLPLRQKDLCYSFQEMTSIKALIAYRQKLIQIRYLPYLYVIIIEE